MEIVRILFPLRCTVIIIVLFRGEFFFFFMVQCKIFLCADLAVWNKGMFNFIR